MRVDGVKGHLDLLLLGVLSAGPAHGYAVIASLRERTGLELTEGAVYPALHRLEDLGLLVSDWQPVAGRRRRVYRITSAGHSALHQEKKEWNALRAAVEAVLHPGSAAMAVG
jgi:DNA-binding PadR family transcriptional regulator